MNKKTIIKWLIIIVGILFARRVVAGVVKDTFSGAAGGLNIASPGNIFYRGANNIWDILDDGIDNDSGNVGAGIYDWFN